MLHIILLSKHIGLINADCIGPSEGTLQVPTLRQTLDLAKAPLLGCDRSQYDHTIVNPPVKTMESVSPNISS
jgi:hypothetical protein